MGIKNRVSIDFFLDLTKNFLFNTSVIGEHLKVGFEKFTGKSFLTL